MKSIILKISMVALMAFSFVMVAQGQGQIVFDKTLHDFGNIQEKGGKVTHRFEFANKGNAPVTILNVRPSCSCTISGWTKEPIAPGKRGYVDATFSPLGYNGNFNKSINVTTNGVPEQIVLRISGVVLKAPLTLEEEYPIKAEVLRMTSRTFAFGRCIKNEIRTTEIKIYNSGDKPISLSFKDVPSYIQLTQEPAVLEPKAKGVIKCRYDSGKKNEWGTSNEFIYFTMKGIDSRNGNCVVNTNITIIPDIDKNMQSAPVARFDNTSFTFTNVKAGLVVSKEFTLTNTGNAVLEIFSVKPSSSFVSVKCSKNKLNAGESATITTSINTSNLNVGTQSFSVEVINNAPISPVVILTLIGNIIK